MTDNVSVSRQICGNYANDKGRLMDDISPEDLADE